MGVALNSANLCTDQEIKAVRYSAELLETCINLALLNIGVVRLDKAH